MITQYANKAMEYEYSMFMSLMNVSVGKHLMDEHYTVIWANDCFYQLIGYTREECTKIFHNQVDLFFQDHPDVMTQIRATISDAFLRGDKGYEYECRLPAKDGRLWIRVTGRFTDEVLNGKPVVYTVFTDITDLKLAQIEQTITYDNFPGFMARFKMVEERLEFMDANNKFFTFFGVTKPDGEKEIINMMDSDENRQTVREHLKLVKAGKPASFVVKTKRYNGSDCWFKLNADCTGEWKDGYPVCIIVYIDITEQKELQLQVEERSEMLNNALETTKRANQVKSDFLSRMSHDIRTPMNAILGMTALAMESLGDEETAKNYLKKVQTSGKYLLCLINDILDMSKIESGKMVLNREKFDILQSIEEIIAMFDTEAACRKIQFHVTVDPKLNRFYEGDQLKMKQIVINLLSNAVKFTDSGGKVQLTVDEVCRKYNSAKLLFTVKDTGRGMGNKFLEKIFLPYEQDIGSGRQPEGSGLGLTIAYHLCQMMNGTIEVESRQKVGSQFKASVWVDLCIAEELIRQPQGSHTLFNGERILVVEDNELNIEIVRELLELRNLSVDVAKNGKEAVELFEKVESRTYMAILMDIQMPVMNGLEAAQQIRKSSHPDALTIPIYAMSANTFEDDRKSSLNAGMDGHLMKPVDIVQVVAVLKDIQEKHAYASPMYDNVE